MPLGRVSLHGLGRCFAAILNHFLKKKKKNKTLSSQEKVKFSILFKGLVRAEYFPGVSDGEASACSVGDPGSIHGLGRSPGEGNGTPLQYSCLEDSMDGGAW